MGVCNNKGGFSFKGKTVDLDSDFEKFKNRECKAKDIFTIREIEKDTAYKFVRKYHYLGDARFFCYRAYGLIHKASKTLVGCATYSQPQGNVSLKGWFGLDNDVTNIFELSRLCMLPSLNKTNATSFLLSGSIKEMQRENHEKEHLFRKEGKEFKAEDYICRAVITLACSERHIGSIYQVCNFKYYGLSDFKSDFYDSEGRVNPRGETSDKQGVWLPRSRKHRYAFVLDKSLKVLYDEETRPSLDQVFSVDCCHGTNRVFDNRFKVWWTCPRCTGKMERIGCEEPKEEEQEN